jgi:cell division transport system permease protein
MAIGMIAVSLAIFGIFWLIYANLHAVAKRWAGDVHIIVYLQDSITEDQRLGLDAKIRTLEHVHDLRYISPDEALASFKNRLGDQAYLIEGIETNPLPASFEIQLTKKHRDLSSVRSVAKSIKGMPNIEDIHYGEQWLENLTTVIRLLEFIGIFLGIFLFLTVIFIISNTIKLTLYSREEEVTIMKFIGASESFIKGPFLAEGVIRGFVGALVALGLLVGIHRLFLLAMSYSSNTILAFANISFLPWPSIVGMTLLGAFLGWCGSLLTLHKFLKTY